MIFSDVICLCDGPTTVIYIFRRAVCNYNICSTESSSCVHDKHRNNNDGSENQGSIYSYTQLGSGTGGIELERMMGISIQMAECRSDIQLLLLLYWLSISSWKWRDKLETNLFYIRYVPKSSLNRATTTAKVVWPDPSVVATRLWMDTVE